MQCGDVRSLLSEYLDEWLKPEVRRRVDTHLQDCDSCRADLAAQNRALVVLERAAGGPAPDLWQSFSHRLAGGIACREVRDLLPAYQEAALSGAHAVSVHNHLKNCAACAVEAERLEASMELLDRVAEMPTIDLWPAFQERQDAERRSRERGLGRLRSALRALWQGPVLQPALGLAAAGLLILTGQQFHDAPAERAPAAPAPVQPTRLATSVLPPDTLKLEQRVSPPLAKRSTSERRKPSGRRIARRAGTVAGRTAGMRTRVTAPAAPQRKKAWSLPAERTEKEILVAAVPAPSDGVWTSQLQVSYDLPTGSMAVDDTPAPRRPDPGADHAVDRALFHSAVEVNSSRAQAEVKSEVVQVVQLLAGIEEASENPFRSETDGY